MDDDASDRLEAVYRTCADNVYAYAVSRVGPDRAPDAVAETFLVAWRRVAELPEEPLPWLIGVARRVTSTFHREDGRRLRLVHRLATRVPVEKTVVAHDELGRDAALHTALDRLSPVDREALVLTAWLDLSVAEAAQVQGCSPGTFSVRVHRARQRLRAHVEQVEANDEDDAAYGAAEKGIVR